MKKIILLLVLSLSGKNTFASANCSGDSVPVLAKYAKLYLNVYSVSIDALKSYSQLDPSKVDSVERDLAICNTIGEQGKSLMDANRAMRELQFKIQSGCFQGDPVQLDNYFWAITEADINLKHFCFKGYGDGYRDINVLKSHLIVSSNALIKYSDLLSEYQKSTIVTNQSQ